MSFETILFHKDGPVATIAFNRPQRKNAVGPQTVEELLKALADVAADSSVKVLVLTGAGGIFCSGGDLQSEMFQPKPPIADKAMTARYGDVTFAIRSLPKPVIAAVDGAAVGIGFHYALACDIIIASDKARFSEGFAGIGLHPDGGGTYLLPRLVGVAKALELIFTNRMIDAQEAERIGIINRAVPAEKLEAAVKEMAQSIASGPSIAFGLAKISVYQAQSLDLASALEAEARAQAICLHTEDHREGVTAFLAKRKPQFKGK